MPTNHEEVYKRLWRLSDEWMQDGEEFCGPELREMSKCHADQLRAQLPGRWEFLERIKQQGRIP